MAAGLPMRVIKESRRTEKTGHRGTARQRRPAISIPAAEVSRAALVPGTIGVAQALHAGHGGEVADLHVAAAPGFARRGVARDRNVGRAGVASGSRTIASGSRMIASGSRTTAGRCGRCRHPARRRNGRPSRSARGRRVSGSAARGHRPTRRATRAAGRAASRAARGGRATGRAVLHGSARNVRDVGRGDVAARAAQQPHAGRYGSVMSPTSTTGSISRRAKHLETKLRTPTGPATADAVQVCPRRHTLPRSRTALAVLTVRRTRRRCWPGRRRRPCSKRRPPS